MSRTPTKYEIAAMWLYGEDYAVSGLSIYDFFDRLSPSRRDNVVRMVDEILAAPFGTFSKSRRHVSGAPTPASGERGAPAPPTTERYQNVLTYAAEEARLLGHTLIGTQHLLLGLLREEGIAIAVLANLNVDLERVTLEKARKVTAMLTNGKPPRPEPSPAQTWVQMPQNPDEVLSRTTVAAALRDAKSALTCRSAYDALYLKGVETTFREIEIRLGIPPEEGKE